MKLEYLGNISEDGKFKQVVSENLIRLFAFDEAENRQLIDLFLQRLITGNDTLNLSEVDFIQPVNCQLILSVADTDEGIMETEQSDLFICKLTQASYQKAVAMMNAIASGHNWLCDTSADHIDFLYSPGGNW